MASKASLLNFLLIAIDDLLQCSDLQLPRKVVLCLSTIEVGQLAKGGQLVVVNIGPVLLGEQIGLGPELAGFRQNDRPLPIVVETFLENASTESVRLTSLDLSDGKTKHLVSNPRLPGGLREPCRFEDASAHDFM